ncbi:MAG: type IV pilin protein [Legionella longbeachae]|nr:type IV pilin protein [Legionella longbeachae]
MSQKKINGFSMIELMITVIIIAILSSIAYPYYVNFLLKSRRSDALATLAQDQIILERCYSQNFSYNQACTSLPNFPQISAQGFYNISLTNLGATSYTLTATPRGSQVKDTTCASMTIDQAGLKTAVDSLGAAQTICWNPT